MSRTITSLSAVVALPSINRRVEKNTGLALDAQLERIRLMIRRMELILLAQLNVKTIRHRVRILHSSEELAVTTATLVGNEFQAYPSIRETHTLQSDHSYISTMFDEYLGQNIEVLFLIPHPEVSCSTLIRHISNGQLLSESAERDLYPGQARIWYPRCSGDEYFTWNNQPLT